MLRAMRWTAVTLVIVTMSTSALNAQLIVGQENENEPVFHVDISTGLGTPLFTPANGGVDFAGIEGLDVDDAGRTIYFTTGLGSPSTETLYSAHYDDPDPDLPGQLRIRKVADLTFAGETPRVTGLAWDSIGNRLLTSYQFGVAAIPEGIYEINTATGELSIVMDLDFDQNDIELSGIGFNPLDGFLYATNLDFGNRFLNRIDLTQPPATARTVLANAILASNDEGLALSNGDCGPAASVSCDNRAYIVPDDTGDPIKVFNLVTDAFEADVGLTPFFIDTSSAGAGWGPNALSPLSGVNFCLVTSAVPGNGQDVQLGDQIVYSIRNQNCGDTLAPSGTYTMTLSGPGAVGATIDSVFSDSGLATETISDVEVSATITPFGAGDQDNVTITVTPGAVGDIVLTCTFNPGGATDVYTPNNTEEFSHLVRVLPLASAIASTISGTSSALAPSLGGAEYDSGLGRAYRSPDGTRIAFEASTNFGSTTEDDVLVRYDSGVGTLISQENTSTVGPVLDDLFNEKVSVNNDGYVGYIADTTGTDDEFAVVALDPFTRAFAAREDVVIPASPFQENGWDYGFTLHSANINGNNRISYCSESMGGGIASGENTAIFSANEDGTDTQIVAWEGNTIPTNQAGGGTAAWESFDDGDQWSDGAGCQYLMYGDLVGSSGDDVVVVNNEVIFQEGESIAGTSLTGTLASPGTTTGVIFAEMYSNGDWLAHGVTTDSDQDWVIKGNGSTYSVIAQHGDEIHPGAGEFWSDVDGFSPTFRAVAANNQGDVAIMGRTTEPNTGKNLAIVINSTAVVLREGDPVALDNDGLFDDDAFIGLPNTNEMILTDGGQLILTTQLLNSGGTDIGDAVVTVDVSAYVSPALTGADLIVTKTASTDFIDNVGAPITYTITVCNVGPDDATGVLVNDTLPAEVTFSSATMGATEVLPGMVEANLGSIPAYTSKSFQIVVQSSGEGVAVNTASATANESDPNPGNNSASATTTIQNQVDVGVSKIDNGGASVGMNYDYTVTVTNAGPADATDVVVRDNLPAQVTFVTSSLPDTNGDPAVVDVTIPVVPAGGQVVYTITVTADAQALVTNNISIFSLNEVDTNPANDSFMLDTINGSVADLEITKADSGLLNLGGDITYTIDVTNIGPGTATGVVVTEFLPAGTTLVSVSEAFTDLGGGVIEINYASIPNSGTEQIIVVVTPLSEGTYINTATVTAVEIDPDDLNNSASTSTRVGNFRDMTIIYSEIIGHPTAIVPGARDLAGSPVVTEWKTLEDMAVSPDGSAWLVKGRSKDGSSLEIAMVAGSGLVGDMLAQEGQEIPGEPAGTLFDTFDSDFGFNDNNDVAFGARARGTSTFECFLRDISGTLSVDVRDSDSISGLVDPNGAAGDETHGNSFGTAHLLNDGRIGFYAANIAGLTAPESSFDTALCYWDSISGSVAFLQEGIAMIGGENVAAFSSGNFVTTPDGAHYAAEVGLGPDSLNDEETLIVDGVVEVRQNTNFSGVDIDAIFRVKMAGDGTWFARGDQPGDNDWAISNGNLIAMTGDSVTGGAETLGASFSAVTGDSNGNYVLIADTDEPDEDFNDVIVLNGTHVVAREGDPIDLDGNGMFDDNVFIGRGTNTSSAFLADDVHLTDTGILYFFANLRDSEGNDLGDSFGGGGIAFITMDVSDLLAGGCPTVTGDVDGDGDGDGADVQGAVICILTNGASGGACSCIDYNSSGSADVGDIAGFVADLLDN